MVVLWEHLRDDRRRKMEFSVLDKQTLQCVMTEAEIADYGMDKHAIYQKDARAADFLKQIMQKAQQETGFTKKGGSIAVHAADKTRSDKMAAA